MQFVKSQFRLLIVLCVLITACNTPRQAAPLTSTSIQLSWLHNIEFAGFYQAVEKSYYTDQGLTVDLRSGGIDSAGKVIDPLEQVVSGKADFGIADGTLILTARDQGKPLVAVAAIYQRHPLALVSIKDKNILKPQDLIGKNIQMSEPSRVIFQALLSEQGIDPKQLTIVDRTDFSVDSLVAGKTDVIDGWVITEIATLKAKGIAINTIFPIDYGIEVYPDVIFTTEDTIAKKPALVKQFVAATVHGLQDVVNSPTDGAQATAKYDKVTPPAEVKIGMEESLPFLKPAGSNPGLMTDKVWQSTYQILQDQKLLTKALDYKAAYTLSFLDTTATK